MSKKKLLPLLLPLLLTPSVSSAATVINSVQIKNGDLILLNKSSASCSSTRMDNGFRYKLSCTGFKWNLDSMPLKTQNGIIQNILFENTHNSADAYILYSNPERIKMYPSSSGYVVHGDPTSVNVIKLQPNQKTWLARLLPIRNQVFRR